MDAINLANFNDVLDKLKKIKEGLIKENEDLMNEIEMDKKASTENESLIKEACEELDQIREANYKFDIEIKLEELKQTTCTNETLKFMDLLIKEIESETDMYFQKNRLYHDEYNIDITLLKEKRTIIIKFLNYNQEILIEAKNDNKLKAMCGKEISNEVNENDKLESLIQIIENFNSGSTQSKEFCALLRDLFDN